MAEWQLVESAAIYSGTAGAETASRRLYLKQGGDLFRHSRGGNSFAPALFAAERGFIPAQPGTGAGGAIALRVLCDRLRAQSRGWHPYRQLIPLQCNPLHNRGRDLFQIQSPCLRDR